MQKVRPAYAFDVEGHTVVIGEKTSKKFSLAKWVILQGSLSALTVCILLISTFVLLGTEITLDLGVRIGIISLVGGILGIFIGLGTVIQ